MTRDEVVVGVLLVAFATLATVHITITLGLLVRRPWWRGLVAFVVPPLAPWWGFREKMWARSSFWVLAAIVYGVAFSYGQK